MKKDKLSNDDKIKNFNRSIRKLDNNNTNSKIVDD